MRLIRDAARFRRPGDFQICPKKTPSVARGKSFPSLLPRSTTLHLPAPAWWFSKDLSVEIEGEMREGIVAKNQPSSSAKGTKELEQHNQYLVPEKLFKKCELPLRLLEVFLGVRAILALQRGLRLGHVGLHSTLRGHHVTAQSVALPALRAL